MQSSNLNISQSLIKAYLEYCKGDLCGLQLEAIYIKKLFQIDSESMALGRYFEFIATGQRPKDGTTPLPLRTAKGHLTAEYKRAEDQAKRFKTFCEQMDIEILETGTYIQRDGMECTLDIIALVKGEKADIDLKYTAKLYNRWDKDGWDINTLHEKDYHMIQARMYHHLSGLPFYFWLFSSSNDDSQLIKVNIDQNDKPLFNDLVESIRQGIELESIQGFRPIPDYKRCKECPEGLSSQCPFKASTPIIKQIYYTQTA